MPPWTYREMEAEFNRRQMAGLPCDGLAKLMVAVLSPETLIARMDVEPDGSKVPPCPFLVHPGEAA